ncbi:MAG: restriction endonuclease subunit S [Actinobacteria bacterium]|nr:restriction endonuclease subunit S [Actinomycetota bacterium]MBU2111694.1 restriction endonuclease subunit S [Actinomycetota bacterium]
MTFKPDDKNSDGVGVMRTKNVQEVLDLSDIIRISPAHVKRKEQYLQPGDILISSANSWYAVGKACWVPELDEPLAIGGFVTALRPRAGAVDARYLYRWFTSPRTQATLRSFSNKTTNISNLNLKLAAAMPVPLPTPTEQRRIAAILDHADTLRAKRRQILVHLDALTGSIFNDMFSGGGFKCVALKEAIKWRSGKFLPAKEQKPGAHPVYGGNGVNGSHDDYMFEEPRLVVGRVGAYCGAVHLTKPFSWVTDNALVATLLRDDLTLDYLLPALSLANLNQYAGVSGQPSISAGKIGDASIPVPPPELQRAFADRVAKIRIQTAVTRIAESTDSDLFASLQSRAFRGEL